MKRVLVPFALAVLMGGSLGVAPSAPPLTGVAFDEVSTSVDSHATLPQPADFELVHARVQSDLSQHANESPSVRSIAYGRVAHISNFGDLERDDIPGDPVYRIYNNKAKWIKVIDTHNHTYVRETTPEPQVYSVSKGKSITVPARPSPWPDALVRLGVDNTQLPGLVVDGEKIAGFKSTVIARVDTPNCRTVQFRAELTTYATPAFLEPPGSQNQYEAPFRFGPQALAASQCAIPKFSQEAAKLLPSYPQFIVYRAEYLVTERPEQQGTSPPFATTIRITMRAHVRALHSSDATLFETPSGYKWDPSLAD